MKNNWRLTLLLFFLSCPVFAQNADITGKFDWEKMEIQAIVSLNLASAGIKLPGGRTTGESIINSEYRRLMRPHILGIQADSSSTLGDLVRNGELSLADIDNFVLNARFTPHFLSPDLLTLQASCIIDLENISASLIRHSRPAEIRRTLSPVPAPDYTGIIIIASSPLPVHGMKSSASVVPCLFPKIWDTNMNLLYERNMLEKGRKTIARYAPESDIFINNPSGLSPEIARLVGSNPLRIIARRLFGDTPTDLIIESEDALRIISTEQNRRLLSEGRVVIVIDDSAIRMEFQDH